MQVKLWNIISVLSLLILSGCVSEAVKEDSDISVQSRDSIETGSFTVREVAPLRGRVKTAINCSEEGVEYVLVPYYEALFDFEKTRLPNGFGSNIPLGLFLEQQLPKSIKVFMASDIGKNKIISWKGEGVAWQENLDAVSLEYGFKFIVDNKEKRLIVKDGNLNESGLFVYEKRAITSVCLPYYKVKKWEFNKGEKLTVLIESWNKKIGWDINWEAPIDIEIKKSDVVIGNLLEAIQVVLARSVDRGEIKSTIQMLVNDEMKTINIKEIK